MSNGPSVRRPSLVSQLLLKWCSLGLITFARYVLFAYVPFNIIDKWTYEVKTYETYEEVEEVEEVIDDKEVETAIARGECTIVNDVVVKKEAVTTTTVDVVEVKETTETESVIEVEEDKKVKEVVIVKGTGVAQPAVTKETSWFRKLATGAGAAAAGALTQVDGVWKRTVQVLTTRKAHVDERCPIAKTSYVYYDDDVYDSVLIDNTSGVTHVNQLLYDTKTESYYIYIRWSETDYKLDGPYETIESAKSAYLITYKEWYGIEWTERETSHSGKFQFIRVMIRCNYCPVNSPY